MDHSQCKKVQRLPYGILDLTKVIRHRKYLGSIIFINRLVYNRCTWLLLSPCLRELCANPEDCEVRSLCRRRPVPQKWSGAPPPSGALPSSSHQYGAPLTAILQGRPSPSAVVSQEGRKVPTLCTRTLRDSPETIYYCVPEAFDHHSDISCSKRARHIGSPVQGRLTGSTPQLHIDSGVHQCAPTGANVGFSWAS